MDLTGEVVFIGKIEEIKATKYGDKWKVWVTSRTGPQGRDDHRFTVKHDEFSQWLADMFKAEESK